MKELLDNRNQKLWEEIDQNFNVSFEYLPDINYSCYSKNKDVIFYINQKELSKDSFTHELLHVYLRSKEFFIGASLELTIQGSKILSKLLSHRLIEHMGNCLDHIKMFPIYLDMGFDKTKFIADYNLYKCDDEELSQFKKYYRNKNKINPDLVDSFVGRVVSILADPNDEFDYENDLKQLKQIDPLLYNAIEKLFTDWVNVKLENREIIEPDDHTVVYEFYQSLKKWISINKFQ